MAMEGSFAGESSLERHVAMLSGTRSDVQMASLVMNLQQTYGNRYVQRLVESVNVRAKLTVNQPDDRFEREADRAAEAVAGDTASGVQRQEGEEEEAEVQTKSPENKIQMVSEDLESRIKEARGSGQSLGNTARKPMERAFGADFSGVRVHTDSQADELNRQLSARAFTAGHDIFFRQGEYNPDSGGGRKLIAHELTHTIQQGASSRIARWGMFQTSHETVTKDAFKENDLNKKYSVDAQDYIASFADSMDMRARMWWHYIKDKIKNKNVLPRIKEDPKAYETLEGYELNEDESKNHAEGGLYKSDSGEGANKARVQKWVGDAIAAWKAGNKNQALSTLGLGLHTAEDRGSHGEGKPGKGHDPRRLIPAPEGSSVNYYQEGWENADCDRKEKNPGGYSEAVGYGSETLQQFYESVKGEGDSDESFVITPQAASALYPGWMEKFVRKVAICFGTQPEEVAAFWADKLKALASWGAAKVNALISWSAENLKALMNWTAEKLEALASWSAEKLKALASWSAEKIKALAGWSAEKLKALASWTAEKFTKFANWTAEKLTSAANWTLEKLNAIGGWLRGKMRALAGVFS